MNSDQAAALAVQFFPEGCNICGSPVKFTDSIEVYHTRSYGNIYLCVNAKCGARVGVHKDNNYPLGTLADEATRKARKKAHAMFDRLWKGKKLDRKDAYKEMQKIMGMSEEEAHIGRFSVEQCNYPIEQLQDGYKLTTNNMHVPPKACTGAYEQLREKLGLEHLKNDVYIDKDGKKFLLTQYGFQNAEQLNFRLELKTLRDDLDSVTRERDRYHKKHLEQLANTGEIIGKKRIKYLKKLYLSSLNESAEEKLQIILDYLGITQQIKKEIEETKRPS